MKINFLSITTILIVLGFMSCEIGDESPVRNFYTFMVDIELDPIKNEYLSGDLLWLSTSIDGKNFVDEQSGETVKVGNGRFTFQLDIFDPFAEPDDSDKFSLAIQSGEVTEINDFEETGSAIIAFGCPSGSYTMQVGVQFIKKGGYLFYLNQENPFPQVIFTQDEDCSIIPINNIPPDNADIGTTQYTFKVSDTNKEQFESYAAEFATPEVDLEPIRAALDEGRAFFVLVN